MVYYIYSRKKAMSKGLNVAFLRSVPSKRLAKIYTGGQTEDYIIKRVKKRKR